MRLFGTYNGKPVVAWAVFQGTDGARVVVMGDQPTPFDIPLSDFQLPKLPKRLKKKIHAYVKAETKAAQVELGNQVPN